MKIAHALLATLALALTNQAHAGPIAYGICQTGKARVRIYVMPKPRLKAWPPPGCNTVAVACYAAAGFTFGTVIAAPAVPAVILGCNTALGTCSTACATVALFAPTP